MPASIYAWLPEEREDEERKQLLEGLYRELDECTEVKITTRNRLKIFLRSGGRLLDFHTGKPADHLYFKFFPGKLLFRP